jgi:hypothetical protein
LRYLFHAVSRSSYYEDIEGAEFDLDADAMTHAAVIALELAIDSSLLGFSMLVVNERGDIVGRVPIATAD